MATLITENGLTCKPNAAIEGKWHAFGVSKRKKIHLNLARSTLQATFVRRLQQVMGEKEISDNELSKKIPGGDGGALQANISRITGCRQDPSLEKVEQIATALGVHPLFLLMEVGQPKDDTVKKFPEFPSMFGTRAAPKKSRVRGKN